MRDQTFESGFGRPQYISSINVFYLTKFIKKLSLFMNLWNVLPNLDDAKWYPLFYSIKVQNVNLSNKTGNPSIKSKSRHLKVQLEN